MRQKTIIITIQSDARTSWIQTNAELLNHAAKAAEIITGMATNGPRPAVRVTMADEPLTPTKSHVSHD